MSNQLNAIISGGRVSLRRVMSRMVLKAISWYNFVVDLRSIGKPVDLVAPEDVKRNTDPPFDVVLYCLLESEPRTRASSSKGSRLVSAEDLGRCWAVDTQVGKRAPGCAGVKLGRCRYE